MHACRTIPRFRDCVAAGYTIELDARCRGAELRDLESFILGSGVGFTFVARAEAHDHRRQGFSPRSALNTSSRDTIFECEPVAVPSLHPMYGSANLDATMLVTPRIVPGISELT